jgi:hypothetical protein
VRSENHILIRDDWTITAASLQSLALLGVEAGSLAAAEARIQDWVVEWDAVVEQLQRPAVGGGLVLRFLPPAAARERAMGRLAGTRGRAASASDPAAVSQPGSRRRSLTPVPSFPVALPSPAAARGNGADAEGVWVRALLQTIALPGGVAVHVLHWTRAAPAADPTDKRAARGSCTDAVTVVDIVPLDDASSAVRRTRSGNTRRIGRDADAANTTTGSSTAAGVTATVSTSRGGESDRSFDVAAATRVPGGGQAVPIAPPSRATSRPAGHPPVPVGSAAGCPVMIRVDVLTDSAAGSGAVLPHPLPSPSVASQPAPPKVVGATPSEATAAGEEEEDAHIFVTATDVSASDSASEVGSAGAPSSGVHRSPEARPPRRLLPTADALLTPPPGLLAISAAVGVAPGTGSGSHDESGGGDQLAPLVRFPPPQPLGRGRSTGSSGGGGGAGTVVRSAMRASSVRQVSGGSAGAAKRVMLPADVTAIEPSAASAAGVGALTEPWAVKRLASSDDAWAVAAAPAAVAIGVAVADAAAATVTTAAAPSVPSAAAHTQPAGGTASDRDRSSNGSSKRSAGVRLQAKLRRLLEDGSVDRLLPGLWWLRIAGVVITLTTVALAVFLVRASGNECGRVGWCGRQRQPPSPMPPPFPRPTLCRPCS